MARGHRAGGREMDSSARRLTTDCCRSASRCDFASSGLRGTGQLPFIVRERTLEGPEDFRKSAAPFDELLRSEEHTSELQSLMRSSYAVFCLKKKKKTHTNKS